MWEWGKVDVFQMGRQSHETPHGEKCRYGWMRGPCKCTLSERSCSLEKDIMQTYIEVYGYCRAEYMGNRGTQILWTVYSLEDNKIMFEMES